MRGRRIEYSGDDRTRPMKDRVREAIFNLLGPHVVGMHAIDLFAGTGALAFEALSRGAACATMFEQHFPTAESMARNAEALGIRERCRIHGADTFTWFRRPTDLRFPGFESAPWLVFVSPPFDFFVDRQAEMLALLDRVLGEAPPGGACVVESDKRFDFDSLPAPEAWDRREYPPARVALRWLPEETRAES